MSESSMASASLAPGLLLAAPRLGDQHAITGAREIIEAIARGEGPTSFRLLLGYAGWGPGQLEGEIGAGAWLPASLDASLLFAGDAEELWDAAYQTTVGAHA